MRFFEKLKDASLRYGNIACMGIDPDLNRIPVEGNVFDRLVVFYLSILDEMNKRKVYPSMVKPNVAYFEQFGLDGYRALEKIISEYSSAGLMVLLDAKRGDIDRTNKAYAKSIFEVLKCDAVTVNPYMGVESLEPFIQYLSSGKGMYVLARTSNPGAKDFQEQMVGTEALYERVVRLFLKEELDGMGFVMGGTSPSCLKKILDQVELSQREVSLLIPGFGAQGASATEIRALFGNYPSTLLLHRMNSSSGINYAWESSPASSSYYAEAAVTSLQKFIENCSI